MFSLNLTTGKLLPHLMLNKKKKSFSNNMNFISDLDHYNLAHWLCFNGELSACERLFPFLHPQDLFPYVAFITRVLSPQNNGGMANVSERN